MKRWPAHTRIQTILFPRDTWTAREARSWLSAHGKKAPRVDKTQDYLRYQQAQPGRFKKSTFRTITLPGTKIKAVTALPKKTPKRQNPSEVADMEILAINPRKRKKRAAKKASKPKRRRASAKPKPKKRGNPMAKKRRKTRRRAAPKTRTRTKTVVRYRTRRRRRRNPSRAGVYARQTLAGVNIGGAVKNALPMLLGALAGKAAAKKFAAGGAEADNWTWANYLWCLGGGFIAALGTSAIFKGKRAVAQRIFEGALLLTGYKFFTNDVAPRNTTLESWFGQDEEEARLMESAARVIDPYAGLFGEVTEYPEGDFEMLGQHYVPASVLGQAVTPATARLGQIIEPATARLGLDTSKFFDEAYR